MAKKGLAIAVHILTASGVILGFWSVILILQNDAPNALRVLALAAFIDAIDGTLARRVDVQKHTPYIDGALIDNMVDYLTWVFIPIFWAWSFLDIHFVVGAGVMLSSMFGFAHASAKTPDQFFRGFPSYWNIVILYLYLLDPGVVISSVVLLVLAVLVLSPVKFVYPSRTKVFQKTTLLLSLPYIVMLVVMLWYLDNTPLWLVLVSLYYPAYYVIISGYLTHR